MGLDVKQTCSKGGRGAIDVMHGFSVGNIIAGSGYVLGGITGFAFGSFNFAVRKIVPGLSGGDFRAKYEEYKKSLPSTKLEENETRPEKPGLDTYTGPFAAAGIMSSGIASRFSSTIQKNQWANEKAGSLEERSPSNVRSMAHSGDGSGGDSE